MSPVSTATRWDDRAARDLRSPLRRSARSSPAASATILIALFGPPLAELAFEFGAAEYFSMMVLGLVSAVVLAHGSLIKAVCMILVGLLLGIVGTDVNSGIARYSFGISELSDGIGFVSVAMGMFGFGEIIATSSRARSARSTRRRSAV